MIRPRRLLNSSPHQKYSIYLSITLLPKNLNAVGWKAREYGLLGYFFLAWMMCCLGGGDGVCVMCECCNILRALLSALSLTYPTAEAPTRRSFRSQLFGAILCIFGKAEYSAKSGISRTFWAARSISTMNVKTSFNVYASSIATHYFLKRSLR